jgi:protease I
MARSVIRGRRWGYFHASNEGSKTGEIQARKHDLEPAGTFPVDRAVADASVDEFDALVLPGGTVNPDKLRLDDSAVAFVRDFVRSGKPVAAICHLPWAVDSGRTDVVRDRTLTSYPACAPTFATLAPPS